VAYVQVKENEKFEYALKRFKRKVQQEAIIKEVKKHSIYLKPGERRRLRKLQALKRIHKKLRRSSNEG
jgi:small subunit ribosomal protein S21